MTAANSGLQGPVFGCVQQHKVLSAAGLYSPTSSLIHKVLTASNLDAKVLSATQCRVPRSWPHLVARSGPHLVCQGHAEIQRLAYAGSD